jgi:hypothetical protein
VAQLSTLGHIHAMNHPLFYLVLGLGIVSFIGGESTKRPIIGRALRITGLLLIVLSLIEHFGHSEM